MSVQSISERIYFFVTRQGPEWNVAVDDQTPVRFIDRESAIEAALNGARKIWEDFRQGTGVQIEDAGGAWRVLRTFGA
jgi:hypothetical protein